MKNINRMRIVGASPSDYTSMIPDISNMRTDESPTSFDLYNNNNSDTISVISVVSDISPTLQDYDLEINSTFENKLQQMGMDELKEKCKQNGMNGLSKLKKQDLIQLLLNEFNIIWVMLKNTCLQDLREIYKTNKIKEKKSIGNTKKCIINNIMSYNSKCEVVIFIKSITYQNKLIEKTTELKNDRLENKKKDLEQQLELKKEQQLEIKKEGLENKNNDPEQPLEEDKMKKKKAIPKNVKINIWNTYIDPNIQRHKCVCCKKSIITITEFHVGHVISEHNGGTLEINNLRPICASCNYSMGTNNMIDYIVKYGYYI